MVGWLYIFIWLRPSADVYKYAVMIVFKTSKPFFLADVCDCFVEQQGHRIHYSGKKIVEKKTWAFAIYTKFNVSGLKNAVAPNEISILNTHSPLVFCTIIISHPSSNMFTIHLQIH